MFHMNLIKNFGTIDGKRSPGLSLVDIKIKSIFDPLPVQEVLRKKKYFFRSKLGKGRNNLY